MRTFLYLSLLLLVPGVSQGQSCSELDDDAGYPVVATALAESADSEWLTAVASAAAYRWRVPSRRRNAYEGWERVQHRILPPEPRWADDWDPRESGRAVVRLTIRRDGRQHRAEVVQGSGNRAFDRSLETIASHPMPGSPALPGLPPGETGDSVVVTLTFGDTPDIDPRGIVRFAAVQTRIELETRSLAVQRPPGYSGNFPRMTVKYDVTTEGRVDPVSIEFVRTRGAEFEHQIRDALMKARFRPPTSNCRPIAQSVVQTIGR